MTYHVEFSEHARRCFRKLPGDVAQKLFDAALKLAANPRPHGCLKLVGREDWRIRVGRYRIVYEIDDNNREVLVTDAGPRRDIY